MYRSKIFVHIEIIRLTRSNMFRSINNVEQLLGDDLKENLDRNSKLKIAASCFSIYAYEVLKKELEKIDELKFIFTSPTFILEKDLEGSFPKEKREFYIPKLGRENNLYGTEFEIALKNQMNQKAVAQECARWIRKKVEFKSIKTNQSVQPFIHLANHAQSYAYTPINGFTAADLGYQNNNSILFINRFGDQNYTNNFLSTFNQLWNDPAATENVSEAICKHIESVYEENSPERVYFLILYNVFYDYLQDLDEGYMPNEKTGFKETLIWKKLFNFQKDAALSIINKLDTYNGCILADSVGLGKTFTALAVIKYYELRNRSVLVLCPKRLGDNWLEFNSNYKTNIFHEDRFRYDVLAHTDLDRTTGESFGKKLNLINWGNYDLVVIDESHNFRNNEANKDRETRYQKLMRKVIKDGVDTKVLMLSATPVNNRFADLRNQLALAYEGKSAVLQEKLGLDQSIERVFSQAQGAFNQWSELPAEDRTAANILQMLHFDFFDLLDSVTIARSRKHIQTYYDTADIGQFPKRRKPLSFRAPITRNEQLNTLTFNEIYRTLMNLKLSVYKPISYIYPSRISFYEDMYDTSVKGGQSKFRQKDRESALVSLMTTNLLKRLESSVESFRLTLNALQTRFDEVLSSIHLYRKNASASELMQDSIIDPILLDEEDNTIGDKVRIKLDDMDIDTWERDLVSDLEQIELLISFMKEITPKEDAKLNHLIQHILDKMEKPINGNNRKVIIFSAFADTANYLYREIAPLLKAKLGLNSAVVTGGNNKPQTTITMNRAKFDMQEVLALFSPISKSKDKIIPECNDEIDLLIATDCISEGQNLQDCDYLINYDIHWNPVRIIQRFGRIDRISSKNAEIQLVNYWPDISLDEYINLKERVEGRMVIADAVATADDNLLSSEKHDISYRKEQLRRLQEEVIEIEDVKTGVSITDLGLNEFRLDLIALKEKYGDPKNTPLGLHAVVPANESLGIHPGIIFALRNINHNIVIDQKNRIHPFYLVYIGENGEVLQDQFKVKEIFDFLRSSCKGRNQPLENVCTLFNKNTNDGKDMGYCSELLDKSIRSMIERNEEKDIDSLFSFGETSALMNSIKGLSDFELIAFVVIQKE